MSASSQQVTFLADVTVAGEESLRQPLSLSDCRRVWSEGECGDLCARAPSCTHVVFKGKRATSSSRRGPPACCYLRAQPASRLRHLRCHERRAGFTSVGIPVVSRRRFSLDAEPQCTPTYEPYDDASTQHFFRIPRTGSSSAIRLIQPCKLALHDHNHCGFANGTWCIGDAWRHVDSFAVLREPCDRFESMYAQLSPKAWLDPTGRALRSLAKFVDWANATLGPSACSSDSVGCPVEKSRSLTSTVHRVITWPQAYFISDRTRLGCFHKQHLWQRLLRVAQCTPSGDLGWHMPAYIPNPDPLSPSSLNPVHTIGDLGWHMPAYNPDPQPEQP